MTGALELAPLYEAVLDEGALSALVDDLLGVATLLGVSTKGGACTTANEPDGPPAEQLQLAVRALRIGAIRGLQVRYLLEGRQWWDTLIRIETGVRLVRICHDQARGAS